MAQTPQGQSPCPIPPLCPGVSPTNHQRTTPEMPLAPQTQPLPYCAICHSETQGHHLFSNFSPSASWNSVFCPLLLWTQVFRRAGLYPEKSSASIVWGLFLSSPTAPPWPVMGGCCYCNFSANEIIAFFGQKNTLNELNVLSSTRVWNSLTRKISAGENISKNKVQCITLEAEDYGSEKHSQEVFNFGN